MKTRDQVRSIVERAIKEGKPADQIEARIKAEGYTYNELADTSDIIFGYLYKGLEGVTLGTVDEMAGGLSALAGDDYETSRDAYRTAGELFANANKATATGMEIAGGIPTGILALPGKVNSFKNLAKAGGIMGGISGYGYSESDSLPEQAMDAATGAVTGATLGAATKPAVDFGKKIVGPVINAVSSKNPTRVGRDVVRNLDDDGLSVDAVIDRAKGISPDATLADAGGSNTKMLADHVANTPGKGADVAEDFLTKRDLSQGIRITEKATDLLGKGKNYYDELDALYAKRAEDAGPIYREFVDNVDNQVDMGDLLELLENEPFLMKEFTRAQKDALLNLGDTPINSIRFIDAVKKKLDSKGSAVSRTGDSYKARNLSEKVRSLVSLADESVPQYAQARKAFEVPSKQIDAMTEGRKFMRGDSELVDRQVSKMDTGEKDAFLSGVMREIDNIIMSAPDNADMSKRILGSQKKRNAIKAAFGDDKKYLQFEKFVKNESLMNRTKQQMLGNSATYKRIAKAQQVGGYGDALTDLVTQNPLGAARNLARSVKQEFTTGYSPKEMEHLSKVLFTPMKDAGIPGMKNDLNRKLGLLKLGNAGQTLLNAGILSAENTQITPPVSREIGGLLYR